MRTLSRSLESINFYERERNVDGTYVRNKCGRDFLYYALNYYFPEQFNSTKNNPHQIDSKQLFGKPVPAWLAWTQVQFSNVGTFFDSQGLNLMINGTQITSYWSFVRATLFTSLPLKDALVEIRRSVDADEVCGIDLPIGTGPLVYLDHVMFVYGYDEQNIYVIDTHREPKVDYEHTSKGSFFFKLPLSVIESQWTFTGRVWKVVKK